MSEQNTPPFNGGDKVRLKKIDSETTCGWLVENVILVNDEMSGGRVDARWIANLIRPDGGGFVRETVAASCLEKA